MSESKNNPLVDYYQEVLGIKQILQDLPATATATELRLTQKMVVWVENLALFSDLDLHLLQNMIGAMKIDHEDIALLDLAHKSTQQMQIVSPCVQFDLLRNPINLQTQSYSPQVLHDNKALKAKTWTFLQQMIVRYNQL